MLCCTKSGRLDFVPFPSRLAFLGPSTAGHDVASPCPLPRHDGFLLSTAGAASRPQGKGGERSRSSRRVRAWGLKESGYDAKRLGG